MIRAYISSYMGMVTFSLHDASIIWIKVNSPCHFRYVCFKKLWPLQFHLENGITMLLLYVLKKELCRRTEVLCYSYYQLIWKCRDDSKVPHEASIGSNCLWSDLDKYQTLYSKRVSEKRLQTEESWSKFVLILLIKLPAGLCSIGSKFQWVWEPLNSLLFTLFLTFHLFFKDN